MNFQVEPLNGNCPMMSLTSEQKVPELAQAAIWDHRKLSWRVYPSKMRFQEPRVGKALSDETVPLIVSYRIGNPRELCGEIDLETWIE
jgi:hypothetical protein